MKNRCGFKADPSLILKTADLKVTPSREKILDFFIRQGLPQTLKNLKINFSKEINSVTIYRIVNVFEKKGLIRRVDLRGDSVAYEFYNKGDDHHHITCTSCDKVFDFHGCESDKIISRALKQVSEIDTISDHSLELFGTCKKCTSQK